MSSMDCGNDVLDLSQKLPSECNGTVYRGVAECLKASCLHGATQMVAGELGLPPRAACPKAHVFPGHLTASQTRGSMS